LITGLRPLVGGGGGYAPTLGLVGVILGPRHELDELFADEEFAEAFAVRGQPGWSPGRLMMVTILRSPPRRKGSS
jgi:hypothetical protein